LLSFQFFVISGIIILREEIVSHRKAKS